MIYVVSTAYDAPTMRMCIDSVRQQTVQAKAHVYIDAAAQRPPLEVSRNVYDAVHQIYALDSGAIVVWLDGDDWLAHDRVLEFIDDAYKQPDVWLTYGSYACADGRPGHAAPYDTESYRVEGWKASHLKTFRAALFQKIRRESFLGPDGQWIRNAHDMAIMLPMLEMAGPLHARFVPLVLCVYNYANSLEHRGGTEAVQKERRAEAWLRAQKPYERLESL